MTNLPCLPLIKERLLNACKASKTKIYPNDLEVYMFPQVWGSTSLGFGGMGGQMICSELTTIMGDAQNNVWGVFFGERCAYIVTNPTPEFWNDAREWCMESVPQAHIKYQRKEENNEQKTDNT